MTTIVYCHKSKMIAYDGLVVAGNEITDTQDKKYIKRGDNLFFMEGINNMSYIMSRKLTEKALDGSISIAVDTATENSTTRYCNKCWGIAADGWNHCPHCLIKRIARGDE